MRASRSAAPALTRQLRRSSRSESLVASTQARSADAGLPRRSDALRTCEALARDVGLTAVIDDASERRLAADFAYYPPVPQAFALDWTGSRCEPRIGWEWALLGLEPTPAPPRARSGPAHAAGDDGRQRSVRTDAALRARAGDARSGVSRPLRDRSGRGRSRAASRRQIVGLAPKFRNRRRRRRSRHRICRRRSGARRLRRHGL